MSTDTELKATVDAATNLGIKIVYLTIFQENQHFTPYLVSANFGIAPQTFLHVYALEHTPVFVTVVETACASICLQAAKDIVRVDSRLDASGKYHDSSARLQDLAGTMTKAEEFINALRDDNQMLLAGIAMSVLGVTSVIPGREVDLYSSRACTLLWQACDRLRREIIIAQKLEQPFIDPAASI